MASLSIDRVTKRFGATEVLHEVSIDIEAGDFLVLVGPSGCGKSTLLNMIAGLTELSGGEIRLADRRIDGLEPKARNIAMVFQSYALYPAMTVEKNIAFPLRMAGMDKAAQAAKVAEVAELLQIGHLLKRKPAALSGGQRQRVAMGRALVRDPRLFLFDEPLSNLDAKLRVDMRTEIKRLHQRLGTTIVYVTHDQVEAMTMATKIAVMEGGAVQQFGTPAEIYDRPANRFVATFMGSPAMNLVKGRVRDGAFVAQGAAAAAAGELRLPLPRGTVPLAEGREIELGLRPEWISTEAGPGSVPFAARVELIEPTGPDIYAMLEAAGQSLVARLPARAGLREKTEAALHLDMAQAVVFDPETGASLMAP
ncbi:ABC transporter ATP-binding protein [Roseicyclus amphidinii]|jgi:multiple sugar transport system ATP-binding protein|uniref:ABC transporter ATP-binding protein n=1 Tax=Roseicyclus amphidinii TaxID=3034232 RepID=UPI0024E0C717|nr:sn-glycerol-3-phosphate ABC transporter ATP-binding protein UgpC [Roseicyclus sp. Amp-Y-6]